MKTAVKYKVFIFLLSALILAVAAVLIVPKLVKPEPEPVDPHAGQVCVNDGFDWVWITPLEGVDVSILHRDDFAEKNGDIHYVGEDYIVTRGIDVSEHQHEIDWEQVAASGIDFVYIRAGYRGTTEGGLFEDEYFRENLDGARAAGLDVGVYFFSQAISIEEAIQEARYVTGLLNGIKLSLPIMFDWECEEGYRNEGLDHGTLNDCAVAFCENVKLSGYEAGIYFNKQIGYYRYDLARLSDYTFWLADPGAYPDFYYAGSFWQYSFTGSVPGTSTEIDMNMRFVPIKNSAEADNGN